MSRHADDLYDTPNTDRREKERPQRNPKDYPYTKFQRERSYEKPYQSYLGQKDSGKALQTSANPPSKDITTAAATTTTTAATKTHDYLPRTPR